MNILKTKLSILYPVLTLSLLSMGTDTDMLKPFFFLLFSNLAGIRLLSMSRRCAAFAMSRAVICMLHV